MPVMQADPAGISRAGRWESLRAWRARELCPPRSGPPALLAGLCLVCAGPVRPGYLRCFQCDLHAQSAPGLLADVVAPAAYAAKGGPLARDLWLYKSGRDGSGPAAATVLSLLLLFLHERGPAVWQAAGMGRPSAVCVVPSGRGRPGPHPLRALAAPYLARPWVSLRPRPGGDPWARTLDPARFQATGPLPGAAHTHREAAAAEGAAHRDPSTAASVAPCTRFGRLLPQLHRGARGRKGAALPRQARLPIRP